MKLSKPEIALLFLMLVFALGGVYGWAHRAPRATAAQIEADRKLWQTSAPVPAPTPEPSPARVWVAKEHYEKFQTGLTLAQCNAIVGKPGEEISRAGEGEYELVTVAWSNWLGSNITANFRGGRLVAKAQVGLQ